MKIVLGFFIAAIFTYTITPFVITLAKKYSLVDNPKTRYHPAHTHRGIVPRAGGLALLIGILIPAFIFLPFTKLFIGTIVSCILLVAVGLADDRKDINPRVRLCTNGIATLIIVLSGAGIPYITNPATGGILDLSTWKIPYTFFGPHSLIMWSDLFAFLWIMWTTNIVGWSAGVDGQMPGFVSISAAVIGILSMRFSLSDASQLPVTILAFIVSGAFIGFLPWNFFPQKIMPGYGGKTLAGFLLALLGILSYGKLGTMLLVLSIPTADAAYTLVRRIGKGASPVRADRQHLHHLLLSAGWGRRRIALFYWSVSAILGLVALIVKSDQKVFAFLFVALVVGGFLLWVNYFSRFLKPHGRGNG